MSLTSRIQALTAYANEVTGESDTTLSDAVATLAEGYGQGGGYSLAGIASKTEPSGELVIDATEVPTVAGYAFYENNAITSLIIRGNPTFNGNSHFAHCKGLLSVSAPDLIASPWKCFNGCANLASVSFPSLRYIGGDQFIEGTKITTLVLPALTGNIWSNSIRSNALLTAVDVYSPTIIKGGVFSGCTTLSTFIIRQTDGVPQLENISALGNTPFASGGTGGTLYVPQALISSYQSATNWSTILGYTNNQILPIEGSIYETQYADGTPILM